MNSSCGREEKSRGVEIRRVEKEVGEREGKKKGGKERRESRTRKRRRWRGLSRGRERKRGRKGENPYLLYKVKVTHLTLS